VLDDRHAEVDHSVQAEIQKLADFLGKKKVKVSDKARPAFDTSEVHEVYMRMLRAATSARTPPDEYKRMSDALAAYGPDDKSSAAQMLRGVTARHMDWLGLNERRHRLRLAWDAFFKDYDLLLCPVTSSPAFPHDHSPDRVARTIIVNNKKVPAFDQLFWAGYSGVTFLPATAAPIGLSSDGLPIGVQIVGPQYGDYTCIQFAKLLEQEYRSFEPPPAYQ
jgi:amidase